MKFETDRARVAHRDMAGMISRMEEEVTKALPETSAGDLLVIKRNVVELRMQALRMAHQIDMEERQLAAQCVSQGIFY
jgi:hypothetical protein